LIEWGDEQMMKHPMKLLGFGMAIDKAEEILKSENQSTRSKRKPVVKKSHGNMFEIL
jgi:hypothetical protein